MSPRSILATVRAERRHSTCRFAAAPSACPTWLGNGVPAKPVAADATQVDALHSVDAADAIAKEEPLGRDETIRRATTRSQQLAACSRRTTRSCRRDRGRPRRVQPEAAATGETEVDASTKGGFEGRDSAGHVRRAGRQRTPPRRGSGRGSSFPKNLPVQQARAAARWRASLRRAWPRHVHRRHLRDRCWQWWAECDRRVTASAHTAPQMVGLGTGRSRVLVCCFASSPAAEPTARAWSTRPQYVNPTILTSWRLGGAPEPSLFVVSCEKTKSAVYGLLDRLRTKSYGDQCVRIGHHWSMWRLQPSRRDHRHIYLNIHES